MNSEKKQKDETRVFVTQVAIIFLISITLIAIFGFGIKEFISATPSTYVPSPEEVLSNQAPENNQYVRENTFELNREDRSGTTVTKPTRVTIDSIGVDSVILHPSSPRVDVLDSALKSGAVYYPGSGTIEDGNIFLFGHSTNWAVVQNQAYKTFNDLDKLKRGEEIKLQSGGKTYVYSVETVTRVDSNTAFVDLSKSGRRLTISTCDSFGKKADRWVVDAVFKEVLG